MCYLKFIMGTKGIVLGNLFLLIICLLYVCPIKGINNAYGKDLKGLSSEMPGQFQLTPNDGTASDSSDSDSDLDSESDMLNKNTIQDQVQDQNQYQYQTSDLPSHCDDEGCDLRSWDTPIRDQENEGTGRDYLCSAYSTVAAMENIIMRKYNLEANLSEMALWKYYHVYDVQKAIQSARKYFIKSEVLPEDNIGPNPNLKLKGKIIGATNYFSVDNDGYTVTKKNILNALKNMHPVIFLNNMWGGHYVTVVAYKEKMNNKPGPWIIFKDSYGRYLGKYGHDGSGYGVVNLYDYCKSSRCYFTEIFDAEITN
ncbi:MAG: hypothetical protein HQK53_11930 [Oligoflexia bacterium]|nr:hypothetical protein [Oligoflexia bacterium]